MIEKTLIRKSDIEEKLKRYPEPPEVTEARELILSSFANLEFFEIPHEYILHKPNGEDIKLPSVSSVVHRFEQPVDWDVVRINKAHKEGVDPEELKRAWREKNITSTSNGTITHEFGESMMWAMMGKFDQMLEHTQHRQFEDGYLIPYSMKEKACNAFWLKILNTPNVWPVLPEARIYTGLNDKLKLNNDYCGTFDMLFATKDKKGNVKFHVYDYKTNGSLTNEFARAKGQMMLPPFNDLYDEALSHYTLQLSLYSMGIEQLPIKISSKVLVWLKEDGTYQEVLLQDVTDRLKKVI